MYKHEKQAVERLQSNHIHMLSTLSTAIIAFFLIISLSGTLLFPVRVFADEPQPVAQVGNTAYMSVQDAIGHTSMKNTIQSHCLPILRKALLSPHRKWCAGSRSN